MTTHQTGVEPEHETIRRLARASQELATALSDATRSAGMAEPATPAVTVTSEQADNQVQVEDVRQSRVRRAARVLTWPARRLLDPRFQGLAQQLDQKQIDLFDRLEAHRQEELLHHQAEQAVLARLLALLEQLQPVRADPMPESALTPVERPPVPPSKPNDFRA